MQSVTISLVLLTSVVVSGYHSSIKLRRDGVLNLYPFPRVGRSTAASGPWPGRNTLQDLYYNKINDPEYVEKRHMYAFPRVGRAERTQEPLEGPGGDMRNDAGMWFGTRLGRAGGRQPDDTIYLNNDHSEPELLEPDHGSDRVKRRATLK